MTTETFYVKIKTRGLREYYYQVQSTLRCGFEEISYPSGLQSLWVFQNSTWPDNSRRVKGFVTNMPNLCPIKTYAIDSIYDNRGALVIDWENRFMIDNVTGNFTVLDTNETIS